MRGYDGQAVVIVGRHVGFVQVRKVAVANIMALEAVL